MTVLCNATTVLFDVTRNDSTDPDVDETLTVRGFTQPGVGSVVLIDGKLRYVAALNGSENHLVQIHGR